MDRLRIGGESNSELGQTVLAPSSSMLSVIKSKKNESYQLNDFRNNKQ